MIFERPVSDSSQTPSSEDFEATFLNLILKAEEFTKFAHSSVGDVALPGVSRETMPQITVWRLHLVATSTFLSIIQCLKFRHSSLSSLVLTRCLVEVWAHLDFISDHDEGLTPALRAIRLEAGVLHEWAGNHMKMDQTKDYEHLLKLNATTVERLWRDNGGTGTPATRSYGDVARSLQKFSDRPESSWVNALYGATSTATHVLSADFLLSNTETGVEVTWADPMQRCSWLVHATICYEFLTRVVYIICSEASSGTLSAQLQEQGLVIINDPLVAKELGALIAPDRS
jgi:hypothetical protein